MDAITKAMNLRFRNLRSFYLASGDVVAITSIVRELKPGNNELTYEDAERFSKYLSADSGSKRTQKRRKQISRVLWELFHDPYDELPEWLK